MSVEPGSGTRGIGGIFLRANEPKSLAAWYGHTFGLEPADYGGIEFHSRDLDGRDALTVFAFFERDSDYFEPTQQAMINLRVDDLDATLQALRDSGVRVADETMDEPNGKFSWCYDPEGNRIELWEPREAK